MTYLKSLECPACGQIFDPHLVQTFCQACKSPLVAVYDLASAASALDRDRFNRYPKGMWRWRELLPVSDPACVVSLGEGDTPTLRLDRLGAELGLSHLYLKDEGINPTATFKARGQSAAISRALELSVRRVIIPTAGNAGGAMAAYAARAGLPAAVYMPADTPLANVVECRQCGAEVILVDGLISDAAAQASARASQEGWFDVSTFKEPYRLEGKKTMGFEIAEHFGWTLPDVILYPAGGGMGLVAIWKAFSELETLGWLESRHRPRMVAVQADGCAPLVRAFEQKAHQSEFWAGARTAASGLRVPKSFGDRLVLQAIYESQGTAVAVSDADMLTAVSTLGRLEGVFAAPEGAATLSALLKLHNSGWIRPGERILLLNTGSGLKYIQT